MFACLFAPDFPVQAVLRLEPEDTREVLKQSPIVILEGPASLPRVMSMNEPARLAGVEINMAKLQVETCGRVISRKRSSANENAAQAALLDCAARFSPRVESTAPGTVILDLAGTEKLFGRMQALIQKIALQAAELGFELNIAVAANPDTAFFAARGFTGTTMIPAGEEAERLGSLPIDVLATTQEMLEIMDSWGIRNFHGLALLPPVPLVERLGQQGLQLQKIARGETRRTLVPAEPAADFSESFEFDDPVETLESLTFILNRLIQQVCARLIARSLATNELRLKLGLEVRQLKSNGKKEFYQRAWKLPLPIQDHKVLFRLAYLDLENNAQPAPIQKIIVQAVPVKPWHAQSSLFAPASPETEQLEITLARIRGIVGNTDENGIACVGSPRVLDSHKPDSFAVQSFSGMNEDDEPDSPPAATPIISMRIFRPPLETTVELAQEKPCSVALRKKQLRVLAASGPWRSSGNWWNKSSSWARDEWDVALKTAEGVGFYRIYLDRTSNQWFVEGGFD
jgi:protein ImuB